MGRQREVLVHTAAAEAEIPKITALLHSYPQSFTIYTVPMHMARIQLCKIKRGPGSPEPSNKISVLWHVCGGLWTPYNRQTFMDKLSGESNYSTRSSKRWRTTKMLGTIDMERLTGSFSGSLLPICSPLAFRSKNHLKRRYMLIHTINSLEEHFVLFK